MTNKLPFLHTGLLVLLLTFLACGRKVSSAPTAYNTTTVMTDSGTSPAPRLVILLSVDQMRASYLDRYASLYTGGLKRLRESGMVFDNAHHEHALTLTAPGHATLSTGCYPQRHGVISNEFFNRATKKMQYAVDDPKVMMVGVDEGAPSHSPVNLEVPAIGDWLKKDYRKSKVYSVAFKDRSAILLGGKKPNKAYWYNDVTSRYISSSYYGNRYPQWARELIGTEYLKEDIENGWHKKLEDDAKYEELAGPDGIIQENARFLPTFPHTKVRMGGFVRPESREREMLWTTPLGDKLTLHFARELIEQNQLGSDEITDMLMISCSTADAIGHHFGPDSQEVMDYYLWLDEYLEVFFNYLDNKIGRDNYLVVLSADHGVVTMPEVAASKGIDAKRITIPQFREIMDQFDLNMQKSLGLTTPIIQSANYTGVSLNYEEASKKGISAEQLRQKMGEALQGMYFIEDAFTHEELQNRQLNRPYLELYQRSTFPGRGHDIKLRYKENYLVCYSSAGSSHGSPYDYDNHVPMIYYGFGLPAKRIDRKVATVDIAPTLAALMQLTVNPNQFDGKRLPEVAVAAGQ